MTVCLTKSTGKYMLTGADLLRQQVGDTLRCALHRATDGISQDLYWGWTVCLTPVFRGCDSSQTTSMTYTSLKYAGRAVAEMLRALLGVHGQLGGTRHSGHLLEHALEWYDKLGSDVLYEEIEQFTDQIISARGDAQYVGGFVITISGE